MPKQSESNLSLRIKADFLNLGDGEERPSAAVYAYSTGGRLLHQAAVDAKGNSTLELTIPKTPTGVRLLIGPALARGESPQLDELLRRGAVEQHIRVSPKDSAIQIDFPVFPDAWRCWLRGLCLVKGTVLKRIVRDGVPIDFPVCHATVEIYEVDPLYILLPRLPLDILGRLRDILIGKVPPIPDPDPGPLTPSLPDFLPSNPLPRAQALSLEHSEHQVDAESISALHAASGNAALRFAAMSGSDLMFQQALLDNAVLIRPILCWLYPRFVTMQLIGTTTTDECGHFRRFIFTGCHNHDQPDLYFKVKQRLFGFFEVTIYAPTPIACYTRWNYVCGTEVTLHVTHPLAITCKPCPPVIAGDNWVLFMAIGNFPLSRIRGTGQSLVATTNATNLGLTDDGSPWGGTLRPRLEFDNSLRDSLGVLYYRLSWKRSGESDTLYRPLIADISRHYAHMVGTDLVLDAYPLGPKTVGTESGLFEIPPAIPPFGQWSIPDAIEDTASGKFDTVAADGTAILDDTVQIRVELFDPAGAPINIAAKGIRYFVPTSTDLSGTVHTVDAATLGLVAGNTMVITLHGNNEPCQANIAPPSIGAATADPCCGVLEYQAGDNVTLNWSASHPHGFATYEFSIVRGVQVVFSNSGTVGGGSFSATRTVFQLMNDNLPSGCPVGGCTVAGFSENLHVFASAIDGWSRQSQYDGHAVRAFVLAPV